MAEAKRAASTYILQRTPMEVEEGSEVGWSDAGTFATASAAWKHAESKELQGRLRVVCLRGERTGEVTRQYTLK